MNPYRAADIPIEELERRKKLIDGEVDRAKSRKLNEELLKDIAKLRIQIAAAKCARSLKKRAFATLVDLLCSGSLAKMEADAQKAIALFDEERMTQRGMSG